MALRMYWCVLSRQGTTAVRGKIVFRPVTQFSCEMDLGEGMGLHGPGRLPQWDQAGWRGRSRHGRVPDGCLRRRRIQPDPPGSLHRAAGRRRTPASRIAGGVRRRPDPQRTGAATGRPGVNASGSRPGLPARGRRPGPAPSEDCTRRVRRPGGQVPDELVGRAGDVQLGLTLCPPCHDAGEVERYAVVRSLRLEEVPGELPQPGRLDVHAGTLTSGADI